MVQNLFKRIKVRSLHLERGVKAIMKTRNRKKNYGYVEKKI